MYDENCNLVDIYMILYVYIDLYYDIICLY